ncbi:MAG: carbohydrate kinase family protein [Dehalococcoidia bacterium]|nr:carbohydrate kinase family protein [Dehalococcoidia bacterium]
MQILVSGSLAIDRIMTFNGRFGDHIVPERVHQINLSFTVDGFNAYFGGTAGNIAYSLAMLGRIFDQLTPRLIAAIGSDYRDYFTWLGENGIATDDIRIVNEEATASAFIVTDLSDNQITGFNPGAMKHAAGFDFGRLDPADAINIVGPGNLTDMANFTADAVDAGIYTIFDPGQSLPIWDADGLADCISKAHLLVANDYEMALIGEKVGRDEAGLLELAGALVITLGERGVRVITAEGDKLVLSVRTDNVVDPTGAGDAFRGGLILGLIHPVTAAHANQGGSFSSITLRQMERAAQIGSACAHFAIQQPGTQEYRYTREELDAVLERAYGG